MTWHATIRYELLMKFGNNKLLILDKHINYMKPISDIKFKKWLENMKSEMDSIYTNHV